MPDKGQNKEQKQLKSHEVSARNSDFVLDKVIFSNVFEKDIRRIYIYRKSERLAKAIHLITPAFNSSPSLRNRLDGVAVGLIDGAILPPISAREALSRELLALSSLLSVARTGGLLSEMNADLITREAHLLLQEIAGYEEPRISLEDVPTLAELAKRAPDLRSLLETSITLPNLHGEDRTRSERKPVSTTHGVSNEDLATASYKGQSKGRVSDKENTQGHSDRQEAILAVIRTKGASYIKDISTVIRDVSEKTIQRELQTLVAAGILMREGERRWSRYSLA